MDPGASGPNERAAPIGRTRRPVGHVSAAVPKSGGTADGQTGRSSRVDEGRFSLSLEVLGTMSTQHPLSLGEVKRLAGSADTIRLRASRDADLETPIGAFLRLDDGTTPAYLLESVEGGERLGRYSFLGVGPRRLLEVRDGVARIQDRPVGVTDYAPDLPRPGSARCVARVRAPPGRRARGRDAAIHGRGTNARNAPSGSGAGNVV